MVSASPITLKYFLLQWVFIEGNPVKNFNVDKLYCHGGNSENSWLNNNEDNWLSKDDSKFCEEKYKMWLKVIEELKEDRERTKYQAYFLCAVLRILH